MRKLIRILVGVAMLFGAVAVMPTPASADHGEGATASPACNPAQDADCWHEEMPNAAVPTGDLDVCLVTGAVLPGTSFANPAHNPTIPIVNQDPSHSHFTFEEAVINCPLPGSVGELAVDAEGGNDGHMIDVDLGYTGDLPPCGGPDGSLPTLDSIADCIELDPISTNQAQHDFNGHHGSVIESAWSHSSTYVQADGDPAAAPSAPGESNACTDGLDQNKFNISATAAGPRTSQGWGKYIRIGAVVYTWGCFNDGAAPSDGRTTFGAVLAIVPNPLPVDPTGLFPASPLACVLEPFNALPTPDFEPCGFILVGAALRGTALTNL
jgi:hypothetical protein